MRPAAERHQRLSSIDLDIFGMKADPARAGTGERDERDAALDDPIGGAIVQPDPDYAVEATRKNRLALRLGQ